LRAGAALVEHVAFGVAVETKFACGRMRLVACD
jgi:hypothetical protein